MYSRLFAPKSSLTEEVASFGPKPHTLSLSKRSLPVNKRDCTHEEHVRAPRAARAHWSLDKAEIWRCQREGHWLTALFLHQQSLTQHQRASCNAQVDQARSCGKPSACQWQTEPWRHWNLAEQRPFIEASGETIVTSRMWQRSSRAGGWF